MKKSSYCTDFLFSRTNYLIGAGSIIALMGNYYDFNYSKSSKDADIRAIRSDWRVIGNDLRGALKSFEISNKNLIKK